MSRIIGKGRYASETYPQSAAAGGGGAPTGPAGGDLDGTYPDPGVIALEETGGPTRLAYGAIPDGTLLKRVGAFVVGAGFSSPAVNRLNNGNVGGTKLVDVDTTLLNDGDVMYVNSTGAPYAVVKTASAELLAIASPTDVVYVQSAAVPASVWVRQEGITDVKFVANPPAFIDPTLGSDDNDGLTSGANALKTADEWSRRMNGATITADLVTVTCAAGNVGNFFGKIYNKNGSVGGSRLLIIGAKTLSAPMTVASVTAQNPATQQEFWMVKTGGPVLTGAERLRILTSGTANHVGAVGQVRGFEGSDTTHPYTTAWSSELAGTTSVFPSAGDTFAVETLLSTFVADDFEWHGIGNAGSRIDFEDMLNQSVLAFIGGLPGLTATSNVARVTVFGDHRFKRCIFGMIGGGALRVDASGYAFEGCEFNTLVLTTPGGPRGVDFYQGIFRVGAAFIGNVTTSGSVVFEGPATLVTGSWGFGSDTLFSRLGAVSAISLGGQCSINSSGFRMWTPPLGARNAIVTGAAVGVFSFWTASAFATAFGSISASGNPVTLNTRPIVEFSVDYSSNAGVNCNSTTVGALQYMRSITAPAANPVSGGYLFVDIASGALKYRGPGGTVTTLAPS